MDDNQLSYEIIGSAMRVHQYFGDGFLQLSFGGCLENLVNLVNHVKY